MTDQFSVSKADSLRAQVRDAREEYFRISAELDELTLEVRTRFHGMIQPDGNQAIHTLTNHKRAAFEQYQKALSNLTSEVLTVRARDNAAAAHPAAAAGASTVRTNSKSGPWPQLTAREVEVLDRIAMGMTSKEIARDLNISFKTAVTHRTHLMSKFDVGNVALLIRRAIATGHIKA